MSCRGDSSGEKAYSSTRATQSKHQDALHLRTELLRGLRRDVVTGAMLVRRVPFASVFVWYRAANVGNGHDTTQARCLGPDVKFAMIIDTHRQLALCIANVDLAGRIMLQAHRSFSGPVALMFFAGYERRAS